MSYGIKISKEGVNVKDAGPGNLVFDSTKKSFTIEDKAEIKLEWEGGEFNTDTYKTIYVDEKYPTVFAYVKLDEGYFPITPDKDFYVSGYTNSNDDDLLQVQLWVGYDGEKSEANSNCFSIYGSRHTTHYSYPDSYSLDVVYYQMVKEML